MCNSNDFFVSKVQKKYSYMEFSDDEINRLINKNKLKTLKDISDYFDKIVLNIFSGKRKYRLSLEQITINFIETNIKVNKNTTDNINQLKKLEIFFSNVPSDNAINITIQIISSSEKIRKIIENLIANNSVSKISDEFILSLIDSYCIVNNIEIIEDDSYQENADSSINYFFNDLRNCMELTDEEKYNLLVRIKNGEDDLKPIFSECYLRLVVSIAKTVLRKYRNINCDLMDFVNDGTIGLMHAIDKFDLSKGFQISTYATWWIRQTIERSIINNYQSVRIPIHSTEQLRQIERAIRQLENQGKKVNSKTLSEMTNLSVDTIDMLISVPRNLDSLDRVVGDDEESTIGNFIPSGQKLEDDYINNTAYKELLNILKECKVDRLLTENEYIVMMERLGIYGEVKSYQEIADEFGFTKQWAEQTFKHGLEKIRKSKYIDRIKEFYDGLDQRVLKKGRKI